MKSFDEAIKSAGSSSQKLALQIGEGLAVAQGLLQSVGGAMMNLMQAQTQLANAKLENSKQKLDFFAGAVNKMNEDTLKAQINAINAETNTRKSQFDSQLKALDDQAKAESQIVEDQRKEDARLDAEKKKSDLESEKQFQAEMKALKIDEKFLKDSIITKGEINFEKSDAQKKPCPSYLLTAPEGNPTYEITFEK